MIFMFVGSPIVFAQAPALPTLPQQTVNIALPAQGTANCPSLTSGTNCIRTVPASDAKSFQAAINAATCGDTIVLAAGSTYSGNFNIPPTSCSGWIEIASSALASLPSTGNRVGPSDSANMAQIATPNVAPAIQFLPSANHWRLMGLEITTSYVSTSGTVYNLVSAGIQANGAGGISVQSQLPAFLIFDRIYIHGLSNTNTKRGIEMDTQAIAIVDSYCDEIHYNANDSQCFASWNGTGPFLIQNNFIEAGAEDIMFGGDRPSIPNLIPSDITIVGNVMQKNLAWRNQAAPYNWVVKNIFELKNAQRVLLDGNVLQYLWQSGQVGYAFVFTPRGGGTCPWCVVQDVTVTHNLIRHVADGIELASSDSNYPGQTFPTNRVLVQNNVFDDVSSVNWGGHGWVYLLLMATGLQSLHDITLDHNTSFPDSANGAVVVLGDSATAPNVQITNLLSGYGAYGVFGSGAGMGTAALNGFLTNYIYNKNVFISAGGAAQGVYPSGTYWNTTAGVSFTNFASAKYQLLSTSPYHHAGTDGKDVGVWDWACLNNDSAAALSGKFVPGNGCGNSGSVLPEPATNLDATVQ